jgi:hypothetical protein
LKKHIFLGKSPGRAQVSVLLGQKSYTYKPIDNKLMFMTLKIMGAGVFKNYFLLVFFGWLVRCIFRYIVVNTGKYEKISSTKINKIKNAELFKMAAGDGFAGS